MKTITLILLLSIGTVILYKYAYPTYTYRYKMTVEVNTPDGVKSGSSVIEVETIQWSEFLSGITAGHTTDSTAVGEAPFVDLGERGMLFTTLKYDYICNVYGQAYFAEYPNERTKNARMPAYIDAQGFKATLPQEAYPLMVTFKDVADPMTITEVKPEELAIHFGEGVSLKSISVEYTNDEAVARVGGVLTWLAEYYGKRLDGDRFGYSKAKNKLANSLSKGSFSFYKE